MQYKFSWLNNHSVTHLNSLLCYENHIFKYVGGCVRDSIMNKEFNEFDIASNFPVEKNIFYLQNKGVKVIETSVAHGTITVILEGKIFEITTLRKDVSTNGRQATQVEFIDDFYEDAKRRDFTFNALYLCPTTGEITDFFGGIEDLKNGHVKFIGNPQERIKEDNLRILRFFRFYAQYGTNVPDSNLLNILKENAPLLKMLTKERINGEIYKILNGSNLSVLTIMAKYDILQQFLTPDLNAIDNIDNLRTNNSQVNKNLIIAYINEDYTNLTNFILKKNDIKEITAIIQIKYFIEKYSPMEFNEICHLIVKYGVCNIINALECLQSKHVNYRSLYCDFINKIQEKSSKQPNITGHDALALNIENKHISQCLEKLSLYFWLNPIRSKDVYLKELSRIYTLQTYI